MMPDLSYTDLQVVIRALRAHAKNERHIVEGLNPDSPASHVHTDEADRADALVARFAATLDSIA